MGPLGSKGVIVTDDSLGGSVLSGSAVGGAGVSDAIGVSGVGVGLAGGAIVSVFCWQATSKAVPARIQKYFFMSETFSYLRIRGKRAARS